MNQQANSRYKNYRLLWNDDGGHLGNYHPPVSTDQVRRDQFSGLANTGVDAFFCALGPCTGYTTAYPTKATDTEFLLDRYKAGAKLGHLAMWRLAENLQGLLDQGQDYISLQLEESKRLGMDFWLHLRMNDWHHANDCMGENYNLVASKFYAQRRDLLIGQEAVKNLPKSMECMAWFQDYAHPEVRQVRLDIMEDACQQYDVDGFQYDFMRCPGYFKPGQEQAGMASMTDFIRQSRQIIDRISKQKNKPIGFSVRLPNTIIGSENLGLDVRSWVQQGLVDLIVPSTFFHADQEEDMSEWVQLTQGTGIGIYPAIEESYSANHTGDVVSLFFQPPAIIPLSHEMVNAIAARHYQNGVDGLYMFNWFATDFGITGNNGDNRPNNKRPALLVIGEPDKLQCLDKTYVLSRKDGLFPNCLPEHQIPITITEKPTSVYVTVADELEKHRQKLKSVRLRVHYIDTIVEDQIEVKLNGEVVSCINPLKPGDFAYPEGQDQIAAAWLNYDLKDDLPVQGKNSIEFKLCHQPSRSAQEFSIQAVDIELIVKYAND